MLHKAMLVALLGLFLTGCAVYGDGYGHRYSGYDRHHYYSGGDYRVQRYPVYVAPRHYYGDHRDDRRHDQRRYLPAPQPRHYNNDRRAESRHDGRRDRRHEGRRDQRAQDHHAVQSRQGWDGRQSNQHKQPQRSSNQRRDHGSRSGDRRSWETQRN
ncbi:hypothetical protein PH586_03840 [Pseudomonas sp. SA3-5]|uniref:Lipoprotein n=1 Tax=Pseudomonas aestuarii TaxID=3018340 RepID=A0ABT4XBG0_9PSED|nr:hypothetical protein [Pseudomonas aestuarii]MDA7085523.1 hypothetical protein [Pseudomonas aestuarii]